MIDFESRIREQVKAKKKEVKRINENILSLLNVCVDNNIFVRGDRLSNDYAWRLFRSSVTYCFLLMSSLSDPLSKYLKENDVLDKMKECLTALKLMIKLTKTNYDKSGREVDKDQVRKLIIKTQKLYSEEVGPNLDKLVRESLKQCLSKASKIRI